MAFKYYPVDKVWTKKVMPHLNDPELNRILTEDFNKWLDRIDRTLEVGMYPGDFDFASDWRANLLGRLPRYFKYVCWGACHFLVNFNLCLAKLVEPDRDWRIITSDEHSTVWDGEDTLFDLNFMAMNISPQECFDLTISGRMLRKHQYRKTGYA